MGKQAIVEQNKDTLAFSLFGVQPSPDGYAKDSLDEYVQREREREKDYFELNKKYNVERGVEDQYRYRQSQLSSVGRIGLDGHSKTMNSKLKELEELLNNRGVIKCNDIISNLYKPPFSLIDILSVHDNTNRYDVITYEENVRGLGVRLRKYTDRDLDDNHIFP